MLNTEISLIDYNHVYLRKQNYQIVFFSFDQFFLQLKQTNNSSKPNKPSACVINYLHHNSESKSLFNDNERQQKKNWQKNWKIDIFNQQQYQNRQKIKSYTCLIKY